MRVELSNDNWAEIRDISELRNKDRKVVNKAISFHVDENGRPIFAGSMEDDITEAVLKRVVTSWSYPMPLPAEDPGSDDSLGSLDKLTLDDAKALTEAVKEHIKLLKGEDNPAKPGTDPTIA